MENAAAGRAAGRAAAHPLAPEDSPGPQTLVLIAEKGDGPTRTAQPARTTNLKRTKSVCCLSMYYDKNAKGVFFFFFPIQDNMALP